MSKKKPITRKPKKKRTKKKRTASPRITPLPSFQSMEGMLSGFSNFGGGDRKAVDEAQQIMYDAWEAPTAQQAVKLARKALSISPDCADAYNLIADATATTYKEAIELYQMAVEAGERALGEEAFEEDVGYFWGLLETRPYMRARANLAECLREIGRFEEAIGHYWELLRLNPIDNQGLRYLLMSCLIEINRDDEADRLFTQFGDDCMAFWKYTRALLDFRKERESPTATRSLKVAIDVNKYVPSYLLGHKRIPQVLPNHYSMGDDSEAVLYAQENLTAWKNTPGALEWLAINVE